mgnify:FL=1
MPAEDPDLVGRLVGPDTTQLGGPVGGEQQQRHGTVVGLEHGGVEIGDGGAARRDDGGGAS